MRAAAVLLISHGTVDSLDQLPEFLQAIRRGRPADPELLAEVRRRYEAIGGRSPLTAINRSLADQLAAQQGQPVWLAARYGAPALAQVLTEIAASGASELVLLPLAQHSAPVYRAAVAEALAAHGHPLSLRAVDNWGQHPALISLQAQRVQEALASCEPGTRVLFTAHSLPQAVIDAGDPYERELRAAAQAIAAALGLGDAHVAFQSEGMSKGPGGRPMPWLGPTLLEAMRAARGDGVRTLLLAPIGFLADHVEILYDLDIEAQAQAAELGLSLRRSRSLNDDPALVQLLRALLETAR